MMLEGTKPPRFIVVMVIRRRLNVEAKMARRGVSMRAAGSEIHCSDSVRTDRTAGVPESTRGPGGTATRRGRAAAQGLW